MNLNKDFNLIYAAFPHVGKTLNRVRYFNFLLAIVAGVLLYMLFYHTPYWSISFTTQVIAPYQFVGIFVVSLLALFVCVTLYRYLVYHFRLMRWFFRIRSKLLPISLILLSGSPVFAQRSNKDYFHQESSDGRWIVKSTESDGKSYVYTTQDQTDGLVAVFPFLIEDACFSKDGEYIYLLHSKTFWHSSLSRIRTAGWVIEQSRKISDYTSEIALNADESSLIALARSIIRPLDPIKLETRQVIWESSNMRMLTPHPKSSNIIAVQNANLDLQIIDLYSDSSFIIHRKCDKIEELRFNDTGSELIELDDKKQIKSWDVKHRESGKESQKPLLGLSPIIFYSPDTRLVLGASSSLVWNPKRPRPTVWTTNGSYAFNNQIDLGSSITHFSPSGWQFFASTIYQNGINTRFFGQGMEVNSRLNSQYSQKNFSFMSDILKQIRPNVYAGVRYKFRNDNNFTFDLNEPSLQPDHYGGINTGIGLLTRVDSRDNIVFPTSGILFDANFMRYDQFLGSKFSYNEVLVDLRYFNSLDNLPIGSVLAMQLIYQTTFGGNTPFYSLPYLGGDRILRGSWRNLYIDEQVVALQGEIRGNFTNIDPRYGYVIFAGVGNVSPSFSFLQNPTLIGVGGVGYRWQLIPKQRLHFRLDTSISTNGEFAVFSGIGTSF